MEEIILIISYFFIIRYFKGSWNFLMSNPLETKPSDIEDTNNIFKLSSSYCMLRNISLPNKEIDFLMFKITLCYFSKYKNFLFQRNSEERKSKRILKAKYLLSVEVSIHQSFALCPQNEKKRKNKTHQAFKVLSCRENV